MNVLRTVFTLLRRTFECFNSDQVPRQAAALSYFTMFALAPLLVVTVALVGLVYSGDQARDEINQALTENLGNDAAQFVGDLMNNAANPGGEGSSPLIPTLISVGVLLFAAIGLFDQLRVSLNTIWDVTPPQGNGIVLFLKSRLLSFGMLLVIGLLLLISLVVNTAVTAISGQIAENLPAGAFLAQLLNFLISLGVTTLLFALMYRYLPDIRIPWHNLWVGAFVTALLFSLGRLLLAWYLGNAFSASTYGAAGSLVVILLWVNYSAQIILFGAEFTGVYNEWRGRELTEDSSDHHEHTPNTQEPVANPG